MRYLTATVAGLFMFVAVFLLTALLVSLGPKWLRPVIQLGPLWTNNPFGAFLALLAAIHSYRATIARNVNQSG